VNDFDRAQERREEKEEDKAAAELALAEFRHFVRERCCITLDDDDRTVLHGRLEALLEEIEAVVLRDLRPGREKLQCRLQVPYRVVAHICHSGSLEKCRECPEYRLLESSPAGHKGRKGRD
jgi:hypothetical protein